jgi:hypothetical protein
MFLFDKIDEILLRSGFNETQHRIWQTDLKLNRIATFVLLSGETNFLKAGLTDFVRSPFFAQTDLAYPPFFLTDAFSDGHAADPLIGGERSSEKTGRFENKPERESHFSFAVTRPASTR